MVGIFGLGLPINSSPPRTAMPYYISPFYVLHRTATYLYEQQHCLTMVGIFGLCTPINSPPSTPNCPALLYFPLLCRSGNAKLLTAKSNKIIRDECSSRSPSLSMRMKTQIAISGLFKANCPTPLTLNILHMTTWHYNSNGIEEKHQWPHHHPHFHRNENEEIYIYIYHNFRAVQSQLPHTLDLTWFEPLEGGHLSKIMFFFLMWSLE